VLFGNGDGGFRPSRLPSRSQSRLGRRRDFNGDGIPDLVVTNTASNQVSVLLGQQVASYSATGISLSGSGTHNVLTSIVVTEVGCRANRPRCLSLVEPCHPDNQLSHSSFARYFWRPSYCLSATGGGTGNPIIFSVLSGPGYVSGNWLYVTGVGTIVLPLIKQVTRTIPRRPR